MGEHVVVASAGPAGDVVPYIGVAAELSKRGYRVTFIGSDHYRRQALECGLTFVPVGSHEDYARLQRDATVFDRATKSVEQIYEEHYYPQLTRYYEAALRSVEDGAPAVMLCGEFGSFVAAQHYRLPTVRLDCSPATGTFESRYDPPHPERILPFWAAQLARTGSGLQVLRKLNALRRGVPFGRPVARVPLPDTHPFQSLRIRAGLPAGAWASGLEAMKAFDGDLIVCLWPEWFGAPGPDWPRNAVASGFVFPTRPICSPENRRFGPIVATTGSVAAGQQEFFALVAEACRLMDRPAVFVTPHRDNVPANLPASIQFVTHASFGELFQTASLVIHHGGIGTGAYALAAGVPQIIRPMRGDQFDNGNRLVRLGVAKMISLARMSPTRLTALVGSMMTEKVRTSCRYWQQRVDVDAGARLTSDAIERLGFRPAVRTEGALA